LAVYGDRSQYEINQGDIFVDVPVPVPLRQDDQPATVMVISHDCECDKYLRPSRALSEAEAEAWRITVAIIPPIELLTEGRPRAVRDNAMPRYLHLPEEDPLPELVVDLWFEQPARMADVLDSERVASLSPEWREMLWWKIIRLRLGQRYRQILEGQVPPDAA
jgi:hypothetical protein